MSDNVVPFGSLAKPGEPVAAVVATLEELLRRARNGELRALAYATVAEGRGIGVGWIGETGTRNDLVAAVALLDHRLTGSLMPRP